MDSARFGRVLGRGARGAAKTLVAAVDAVAAPDPRAQPAVPRPTTPAQPAAAVPARTQPSAPAAPSTTANATASSTRIPNATVSTASVRPTASNPPPNPNPTAPPASFSRRPPPAVAAARTAAGVAEGSRRFASAVGGRARRLSGVLWLEFTGVFFGIFALSAALGAWRLRDGWAIGGPPRTHLLFAVLIAAAFTWFCISSFVRARHRGRQP